jgi:peptidoglycan/xylan/chitin deacetylase (PgdA/CDA1 family)
MRTRGPLGAFWDVTRDLARGHYPGFVTGRALPRGHIPVFVFHSLDPVVFERHLHFLADNGYTTLDADEHLDVLEGRRTAPDRAVVLTIDDGRGSVWTVGYPLLQRYGLKAVVFLVPGRMQSRPGPLLPHYGAVLNGHATWAEIAGRDEGPDGLLSWEEVHVLSGSGHFDFQSHTLSHARVHVSAELQGFVTPRARKGYAALDVPLVRRNDVDVPPAQIPLGTPIYHFAPRMSDALRYFEPEDAAMACVDLVASTGGEAFFERVSWERSLRDVFPATLATRGRTETAPEREAALLRELAMSKSVIEEHTGRAVRHLCYPWHTSSSDAERLAREAGYVTSHVGKVEVAPVTLPGTDVTQIARVSEDFLETLPGRHRISARTVLYRKLIRRLAPRPSASGKPARP